jgi:hypothetical protein
MTELNAGFVIQFEQDGPSVELGHAFGDKAIAFEVVSHAASPTKRWHVLQSEYGFTSIDDKSSVTLPRTPSVP